NRCQPSRRESRRHQLHHEPGGRLLAAKAHASGGDRELPRRDREAAEDPGPRGAEAGGETMSIPSQVPKKLHDLYLAAEKAKKNAYAPYSKFQVGVAIRTTGGKIFASGNIENVVNGASVCAERGTVQAIMSELGKVEMTEALVLTDGSPPAAPCGVCR